MAPAATLLRYTTCILSAAGIVVFFGSTPAGAFPIGDPAAAYVVPSGTDLSNQDTQDLQHQLQISRGLPTLGGTGGHGWTILPRLDLGVLFTDNALQVSSPRRWDIAPIIAPGVTIIGDTSRVQLRLDYSPALTWYTRTPQQTSLSQQLTATGLVTVVPELAFIDLRAVSGVTPQNGGVGGLTGLTNGSMLGGNNYLPNAGTIGTSRDNQIQTSSLGISPYLLHRFGDYGTARLGLGLQASRYATAPGFGALPLPTTGVTRQNQWTTEETFQFVTGEFLGRFQNTFNVRLAQTETSAAQGVTGIASGSTYSPWTTVTNKLSYALTHAITVFGSIGYENISYGGGYNYRIHGMTWNIGATVNPNPDSQITVSYGFDQGAYSFSANGNYAVSPRTSVGLTYSSRLGTQLQNLQRQLDTLSITGTGSLVNSQSGAPLYVGNNILGVEPGLYRYNTLNANLTANLDRDQILLNVNWTQQESVAGTVTNGTTQGLGGSVQWIHQLRPDLTLTTLVSYTSQQGTSYGNSQTIGASVGLQYLITETLTGRLRYSYFGRNTQNVSSTFYNQYNFSQNLVVLSISKQF